MQFTTVYTNSEQDLTEEIKLSHNLEDLEKIVKEIIGNCRTAIETDNNNIEPLFESKG